MKKKILTVTVTLFITLTASASVDKNNAIIPTACGSENNFESIFQPEVCLNITATNEVVISLKSQNKETHFLVSEIKDADSDPVVFNTYEFIPLIENSIKYIPKISTIDKSKLIQFTFTETNDTLIIESKELGFSTRLKEIDFN